jgi:hypothetical protein
MVTRQPAAETPRHRVLILGGYGTFGGRLAELLARQNEITLVVGGRSLERANRFVAALAPGAERSAVELDRDGDSLDQVLTAVRPDIVVDASGPFQVYGDAPYRVVEACIRLGIDYLALADSPGFVTGVNRFDEAARRQNVFVLSGASSFPVLTVAAARELARGLTSIDSISGGIAPSPYARVGLNVIRAIVGYAGRPVSTIRNGRALTTFPLTETLRYTISPPGRLPLPNILFSLVEVPDLQILPIEFPGLKSVWIGAGPVPEYLHRMLIGLAWLVRLGVLPTLSPFARLFRLVMNAFAHGEHRGGMFVSVAGAAANGLVERSWHLLAEGDDGPYIPSMTCEALILRCLAGRRPAAGARAAAGELGLADFEPVFSGRTIFTGMRENVGRDAEATLYRHILASAYDDLPPAIRQMHDFAGAMTARGTAEIDRGRGLLARLACAIIGFPRAGRSVPVEVTFRRGDGEETWTRSFAGKRFSSTQSEGRGRSGGLLTEWFGPLAFAMALVVKEGRLHLVPRRWSFLGLPMPRSLVPRGLAYESEENGRFHFYVEISLPLVGLVVRYRGWLAPQ